MQKLLVLCVALSVCGALSGCSGSNSDGGESKVISSKGGTAPELTPPDPNKPKPSFGAAGGAAPAAGTPTPGASAADVK